MPLRDYGLPSAVLDELDRVLDGRRRAAEQDGNKPLETVRR